MEATDSILDFPRNPGLRTEFTDYATCMTTAYPSAGGVVIGDYTAVELRHLGL
jgi:hypothetical protein